MRQKDCQAPLGAGQVEALVAARVQARTEKHWGESNRIRDQLSAMGVLLEDGKGGTTWRLAE
jgi:cysteinyl-tRNA synthetase